MTLTLNGTGFVSGSVVNWNGSPRTTNFISGKQLTATINAADIALARTASVTVVNPAPGGGTSNVAFFSITNSTPSVSFGNAPISPTGNAPISVAVGDFNGDGKLDLAIIGSLVDILLGNGDGTFTALHPSLGTARGPISAAVGDFNGDGKLDLAVANNSPGLTILLGNGDGTFTPAAHISAVAADAPFVVAGDFNGDGRLDLALGNPHISNVIILLGNRDGTFAASALASYTPGGSSISAAMGDFNGDGKLDLAVANYNSMTVLLGNGDGTFTAQSSVAGGNPPFGAVGDFNSDGRLDLAMTGGNRNTVSVLLQVPLVMTSPSGLTFGNQVLRSTSPPQTVTLTNTGSSDLSISSIVASGDFVQTNDCRVSPATLTANASCLITLTFTPTVGGARTGSITITDNAPGSPQTVALSGTGIAPVVTLSSPSLTFGSQPVGSTSTPQTVTLTTDRTLIITSIATSAQFAQTNTCGSSLPPGGSCAISVTFKPTVIGIKTGTVTFIDNASNSPQTVGLTGTGTAPVVSLSPPGLSFGNQLLGVTSGAQNLTLTNTSNLPLTISGIVASGDFIQTNNCGTSVPHGANCNITITFKPTVTGTRSGTITITDNAVDSPQTVNLSGTGIAPAVTPTPTSLSFESQYVGTTGLPQNVTIKNTGTAPLTISDIQTSSGFGQTSGCTSSVPVGVSCTIGVFFRPTASGNITGTLTISDDAPGSPHTVALSGTGQDFNIAPAPGSSTTANVARGQTASYTLALAPAGGFNQSVSLSCSGAPAQSTCNVSPGVVTLNPANTTTVTITVTTTAPSMVAPQFGPPPRAPGLLVTMARTRRGLPLLVWILVLALSAGIAWSYNLRGPSHVHGPIRLGFGMALLFVVMLGAISTPGCGGGTSPPVSNPGTPAGNYTLNVAGTFASGTTTLTHDVKLTLTVN